MDKKFYSTIDVVSQLPSEYVCKAVNCHDELLTMLKLAILMIPSSILISKPKDFERIKEAIKKAEA